MHPLYIGNMDNNSNKKRVLIIIPAFNESRGIARLIGELHKNYAEYDLIVINDGSDDDTGVVAEEAGAAVINLPYNLGIGGAVQTGFKLALRDHYDVAVQLDGDAQHDPKYLRHIIDPVATGKLDLCIGSRFMETNTGFQSTFSRRIGIRFFSSLLKIITGIPLTDPTSGFRATGKALIPYFAAYYPIDFPEPEALQMAKRLGKRIGEVPVKMRKRLGGVSSIRSLKTVYYMIKVTLAILIDTLKRK
jgi:glycosyltransferase involved in cell wall biosynthesis